MALILDGTDGITSSGGTNVLQDDAVITANIADGAVSDAKIADGAVTAAKLAAGAVPAPTTDQVLSATASASVGAVGTYAAVRNTAGGTFQPGATRAGSQLLFASLAGNQSSVTVVGTWRVMGFLDGGFTGDASNSTVCLRIS